MESIINKPVNNIIINLGSHFQEKNIQITLFLRMELKTKNDKLHLIPLLKTEKEKCHTCDEELKANELELHSLNCQEKSVEETRCDLCAKEFENHQTLKTHIQESHNFHKNKKYCDKCKKNYSSASALRKHISNVHDKIRKKQMSILCERFQEFYTFEKTLKEHSQ